MIFELPVLAGIIIAIFGGSGFLFASLRYHRDEATKVIEQHATILADMRSLYEAMKVERDELHTEVVGLRVEVGGLRRENAELRSKLKQLEQALEKYANG